MAAVTGLRAPARQLLILAAQQSHGAWLVKGGTVQSTNRSKGAGLPSSMTAAAKCSTDLWGTSWAYSDINASNFGAVYQASVEGVVNVDSGLATRSKAPRGALSVAGDVLQSRILLLGESSPGIALS